MKKYILLIMLMLSLALLPSTLGVFGDYVTEYSIAQVTTGYQPIGGMEGLMKTDNGWSIFNINHNNSRYLILRYDNDFTHIDSTELEHFEAQGFPTGDILYNSDAGYNGTHYWVLHRAIDMAYIYDSDLNFVQNKSLAGGMGSTISWNGSNWLVTRNTPNEGLYDYGADGQSNTLLYMTGESVSSSDTTFTDGLTWFAYNYPQTVLIARDNSGTLVHNFTTDYRGGAVASNGSLLVHTQWDRFKTYDLPSITVGSDYEHIVTTGTNDARSLSFDGTYWWIVSRNDDTWSKYDSDFNFISSFNIGYHGDNWRNGGIHGNNLYAWNQDDNIIYVWNKNGSYSFSFDPSPFVNTAGNLRGMNSNETHLFIDNWLGADLGADVGVFLPDGTYLYNISLETPSDLSLIQSIGMEFDTPSTDIIGVCSDISGIEWGYLCRWDKDGNYISARNFSTMTPVINSSGGYYGMEYVESTNKIYFNARWSAEDSTYSDNRLVYVMDGGNLVDGVIPSVDNDEISENEQAGITINAWATGLGGMAILVSVILLTIKGVITARRKK